MTADLSTSRQMSFSDLEINITVQYFISQVILYCGLLTLPQLRLWREFFVFIFVFPVLYVLTHTGIQDRILSFF